MKNSTAGFNKQSGTEVTPTTCSKPEGELQEHLFSAAFVKLAPGRAVFLVVQTRDIPCYPLRDRSQRALRLLAPAMRKCTVSAAINPRCGCVVLAKNSTSDSSSACTAISSLKFLTAVAAGTVGFQKIEPCQDGHGLFEDLASRRLLFEHLLVLHVVTVGEDARTSFRRMTPLSDRPHFDPIRCRRLALHPRSVMDPCLLLTLFAIALSLWASYRCSPDNSVVAANPGHLCACV
ncbi:hypothetical protein MTO96_013878 [Rhipicephalus appendiculatus]